MHSPRIVIMRGEFYLFQYRDLDVVGICGLTQEKLVKEGFDFRILTLREFSTFWQLVVVRHVGGSKMLTRMLLVIDQRQLLAMGT